VACGRDYSSFHEYGYLDREIINSGQVNAAGIGKKNSDVAY